MEERRIMLLLVDDEARFLATTTKLLERRGFDVIAVRSGVKAIEAAYSYPIDIALLDLNMPGMSGEETLKALKSIRPWMEVVILTGQGSIKSTIECYKQGAFAFLEKPAEQEQLLQALTQAYIRKLTNRMEFIQGRLDSIIATASNEHVELTLDKLRQLEDLNL